MLHARDHLLAHEAALVEIDPAELVHVRLVRKSIAVDEIEAAVGNAECDAVRLVVAGLDQPRAEVGRLVRSEMEGVADLAVPLVADVGTGRSWYDAKE